MTSNEFHAWLDHHVGYYPEVKSWLEKQDNTQRVIESWQTVLRGVTVHDACKASEALYGQETQPRGFGGHARIIKSIISREAELRFRSRTGVQAVKCKYCQDGGWVSVFVGSTELWPQFREKYGDNIHTKPVSIPCYCESGLSKVPHASIRFDPDRHVHTDRPYSMLDDEIKHEIETGKRYQTRIEFTTTPQEF